MATAAGGRLQGSQEARPLHKPTEDLENIDLEAPGSRQKHASLLSTFYNAIILNLTRYDVEIAIATLIIIFFCTVWAIFTRDAGWFVLDVPFSDSETKLAYISVGLQTFTVAVDNTASFSGGRQVMLRAVEISTLSPEAHRLGAFLYVCLLFSLLLTVAMIWYIALFYSYMKGPDPRPDKECAVRFLGACGILVAVLLFSVGTCAYSHMVTGDLVHKLPTIKSLSTLDTSQVHVQTDYAYELTVAAWFFWSIAGTLFLIRRVWARRRPLHEHHLADLDDISLG